MRKWLFSAGILLLLVLGRFWLQSGPRAAVPTVDPITRWNAEHADLTDNAADLYRAAFAALTGKEDPNSCACPGDPVPPEVAIWVQQNEEAIALARQATELPNCWFGMAREPDGNYYGAPELKHMRTLAKLLHWRGLIAAQQHDSATLADSAITLSRMARHVDQGPPDLMTSRVAIAMRALPLDAVTQPMLWPEMSAAERTAYVARVVPILDPPPPLTEAFAGEQELSLWMHLTSTPAGLQWTLLAAPSRVAGEMERYFGPLRALAAAPVERQCDPADPLVARMQTLENEQPSKFNVPRILASILLPSVSRSLTIRIRLITEQRGTRTVLELFTYRDRTDAFPDSLDALDGDFKIDPFSGQPFVYRRTAHGFTLYSVGVNRKDDGGQHDPRFGDEKKDRDFVFWPIPDREPASPATHPSPERGSMPVSSESWSSVHASRCLSAKIRPPTPTLRFACLDLLALFGCVPIAEPPVNLADS